VNGIQAQVSVYPLPRSAIAPAETLGLFQDCAVEVEPDTATSLIVDDDTTIFCALHRAFCQAAEQGQVVMVVTLSNAWPAADRHPDQAHTRTKG
jgi:hypothetical protein